MKKHIIILSIFLLSCSDKKNNSKTNPVIEQQADSLMKVMFHENFTKEEINKVFGELNFGENESKTNKYLKFLLQKKENNIGNFKFYDYDALYKEDSLLLLRLEGVKYSINDSSNSELEISELFDLFYKKYGEPILKKDIEPYYQSDEIYDIYTWKIGDKYVGISLSTHYNSLTTMLYIYLPEIYNEVRNIEEDKNTQERFNKARKNLKSIDKI